MSPEATASSIESQWLEQRVALLPQRLDHFMTDVARRLEEVSIREWGRAKAVSMVGHSPQLYDVQQKIEKVAGFDEPVLITGESGTGKEHLAQALYLLGPRRGRPFVAVNCPQYQEGNLTVSELFGHTKGSFTGAVADRKGCFEVADGGVIFLDEIGDLHSSAQVMLLRALATREFQPLGSTRTRFVNVRVVAASNRTQEDFTSGDGFRSDLFFRLRYFHLELPPLRERGQDWRLLIDYFLAKLRAQYGVAKRFSAESLAILASYPWPGNIRELLSVVTMGYALSDGSLIVPRDFTSLLASRPDPTRTSPERDLYQMVVAGKRSFWDAVHTPFMERDLNRSQVHSLIRRGLIETQGSYRGLVELFQLPDDDYQKFMDFLRHHRLKPPR